MLFIKVLGLKKVTREKKEFKAIPARLVSLGRKALKETRAEKEFLDETAEILKSPALAVNQVRKGILENVVPQAILLKIFLGRLSPPHYHQLQ
jgi:hypothetical protein